MAEKQRKLKHKKCSICERNVTWEWGNKPETCPSCGAIKFDKPPLEAKLFNLQKKFLDNDRDPEVIGEMFPIMQEYSRRIILKLLTGNARYDETKVETKSADTANKLTDYYLAKPQFQIIESFGFYLDKIAKQNMFAQKLKNIDQMEMSMDEYVERHEDNSSALDALQYESEEASNRDDEEKEAKINEAMLIDETMKFVKHMVDSLRRERGYKIAMYQLLLLSALIQKRNKHYFHRVYKIQGQEYKEVFDKVEGAFHRFLTEAYKGDDYGVAEA